MSDSDSDSVEFNRTIFEELHWVPIDPTTPLRPHIGRIMKWNKDKCRAETLRHITLDLELPACKQATLDDVVMTSAEIKCVQLDGQVEAQVAHLNMNVDLMFSTTKENQKILNPKGCKSLISHIENKEEDFFKSIESKVKTNTEALHSGIFGSSNHYCVIIGTVQCESCIQYSPKSNSYIVVSQAAVGSTIIPSIQFNSSFKTKYQNHSYDVLRVEVSKQIDDNNEPLPIIIGYYIRRFDINFSGTKVNRGHLGEGETDQKHRPRFEFYKADNIAKTTY